MLVTIPHVSHNHSTTHYLYFHLKSQAYFPSKTVLVTNISDGKQTHRHTKSMQPFIIRFFTWFQEIAAQ